jgi:hypothetical protein
LRWLCLRGESVPAKKSCNRNCNRREAARFGGALSVWLKLGNYAHSAELQTLEKRKCPHFKTGAFNRSATPPGQSVQIVSLGADSNKP